MAPDSEAHDAALSQTIVDAGFLASATPGEYDALHPVDPDHYELRREIARGGMGRIIEGRDRRIGRSVAIKEVLPALLKLYPSAEAEILLRRFEREARITARLEHPAIVPVYEVGTLDGAPFFAMKRVDGRPLDELIKEAKTYAARIRLLSTLIAVCEALGYAHDRGVVHRDLKPSNILVGAHGETVVIDWGLAKQVDVDEVSLTTAPPVLERDDGLKTTAGSIFGTPLYMAPEQAAGGDVDRCADVYALGSILYHVFAGAPAYLSSKKRPRKSAILEELRAGPPPRLAESATDAPADLIAIIEKAMARDASDRYPSAAELAAELRNFETGKLVATYDYSPSELLRRWLKRHRAAVATALVAALALTIAGGLFVQKLRSARDTAEEQREVALASTSQATRLFSEIGRRELMGADVVQGSFYLVQARLLGADAPGLNVLLGEIERSLRGFITRIGEDAVAEGDEIVAARFSGDGTRLAVAFRSGQLRVVDGVTGVELSRLATAQNIQGLSLERSARFALTDLVGGVHLWDLERGEVLHTFDCPAGQTNGPAGGAISPDGEMIVLTCGVLGTFVFDAVSGDSIATIDFKFPTATPLFSTDGTKLALSSPGLMVAILETPSLKTAALPHSLGNSQTSSILSGDFARASTNGESGLRVYDLTTGETIASLGGAGEQVEVGVLSRSGSFVVAGASDGTISKLDVASGEILSRWQAHSQAISAIAVSLDDRKMVTIGDDRVLRIWDTASGRLRSSTLGLVGDGLPIFSPVGDRLAVVSDDGVALIDAERDDAEKLPVTGTHSRIYTGSVQAPWFLIPNENGVSIVHDDGTVISIDDTAPATSGASSESGDRVILRDGVYDPRTGRRISQPPIFQEGSAFTTISADGNTAAMAVHGFGAQVWDVETGKLLRELDPLGQGIGIAAIALSRDGRVLARPVGFSALRFVAVENGETVHEVSGTFPMLLRGTDTVFSIGGPTLGLFGSADGTQKRVFEHAVQNLNTALSGDSLLVGESNGTLSVFDASSGKKLSTIGTTPYLDARRSAIGGDLAATIGTDNVLRLWNASTGHPTHLRRQGAAISALEVSRDGRQLVLDMSDGVYRYRVPTPTLTIRELVLRLAEVYPESFFNRNFLIGN